MFKITIVVIADALFATKISLTDLPCKKHLLLSQLIRECALRLAAEGRVADNAF